MGNYTQPKHKIKRKNGAGGSQVSFTVWEPDLDEEIKYDEKISSLLRDLANAENNYTALIIDWIRLIIL